MVQVINARVRNALFRTDVGSNLEIFALFFFSLPLCLLFFALRFIIFFLVNKKNLVVDLNRQTMPVRSAG